MPPTDACQGGPLHGQQMSAKDCRASRAMHFAFHEDAWGQTHLYQFKPQSMNAGTWFYVGQIVKPEEQSASVPDPANLDLKIRDMVREELSGIRETVVALCRKVWPINPHKEASVPCVSCSEPLQSGEMLFPHGKPLCGKCFEFGFSSAKEKTDVATRDLQLLQNVPAEQPSS